MPDGGPVKAMVKIATTRMKAIGLRLLIFIFAPGLRPLSVSNAIQPGLGSANKNIYTLK